MTSRELHLIAPGPLDQRTGGYLYNARIIEGLKALGWTVVTHALEGEFPAGDTSAEASLARALERIPQDARVVLDGLAMSSLPEPLWAHRDRLRLIALVHLHLADETGLVASERERLTRLERESLAQCEGAVATSAFTARGLGAYGIPASRVRAVLPGTAPAQVATGPGPGQPPRLLCVGSMSKRKGQDVLVRALARIRSLPWSCVCAGSLTQAPEFADSVLELARTLGLEGRIEFCDELGAEELDAHYHSASLFVLATHFESYGMALTEALVRGLPVVSTLGGAVPDTVPPEVGVLVTPGDEQALAAVLRELLSGPEGAVHRARLAEESLRYGRSLPTWDDAALAFERAVLELLP
ncbi:MAG TPA: glycosyltransferase [Gemmatimonadetes bacterium]|nr:glycosyltransferase [Gemmatimonadota bacterium]